MKPQPNHAIYLRALRDMSEEDRLRKAFELTSLTRELLWAGLRSRHPTMPDRELRQIYLDRLRKSWDRTE